MKYRAVRDWGRFPSGWRIGDVAGVAADSRDRIHVLTRGAHPVIVFDREGNFMTSWGEGLLPWPHGIFIDGADTIFISDSTDHTVRIFDADGTLIDTLGTPGVPQDSGWTPWTSPVQRGTGPFNGVTNVARHGQGDLFVADGYGNARIHVFDAAGRLTDSWGEPGPGPGQFRLPHGIAIDSLGQVFVADRENSRIQVFHPDGAFQRQIVDVHRPDDLAIDAKDTLYVAELGFTAGVIPNGLGATPPPGPAPGARVTVMTSGGTVLARLAPHPASSPHGFLAPHGICVDSTGAVYVGEVSHSAQRGYETATGIAVDLREYRALHKFEPDPTLEHA